MIFLWIFITAVLLAVCFWRARDFLNPAFISGVIWMAIYIMLILTQPMQTLSSLSYGIFVVAYAAFLIGFLAVKPSFQEVSEKVSWNLMQWQPIYRNIVFVGVYAIQLLWIIVLLFSVDMSNGIWQGARNALENSVILSSGFSSVVQNMIPVLFLGCLAMYLCNPIIDNRNCFLLSIFPLLLTMLLSPRGLWFMVIIAAAIIMILVYRPNNKKILFVAVIGFVAIVAMFIISSLSKFSDAMEGWDIERKLDTFFTSYFTGPSVAFINWMDSSPMLTWGTHIFRFFFAIINKLGFDVEVVPTIQEFVLIDNTATNVFTSLYWYTIDFGIVGMCVIEFGLGTLYGFLYKQVRAQRNPALHSIVIYSLMVYPIVNQFFDDVLFSRLSMWIQRLCWIFLFTKIFCKGDKLGMFFLKWIKPIYDCIEKLLCKTKGCCITLWRKYLCKNQTQEE